MSTYKLFWKLASALGEWGYVLPKRIGISYSKWLCSRLLHVYETGISSHEMYMFTKPNPSYNSNRNHSCKKSAEETSQAANAYLLTSSRLFRSAFFFFFSAAKVSFMCFKSDSVLTSTCQRRQNLKLPKILVNTT